MATSVYKDPSSMEEKLSARLPTSSYSSLLPYQIPQVKTVLKSILPSVDTIIDATAHIGGDALNFAEFYPSASVLAIDNDPRAIDCLRINVQKLHFTNRFTIVCAESYSYITTNNPAADLFYFDPPWGGPSYLNKKEIDLYLGGHPILSLINYVLDMRLSPRVLLKVPRNFSYPKFKESVHGQSKLYYIRKPQKKGIIAYGLVYIEYRDLPQKNEVKCCDTELIVQGAGDVIHSEKPSTTLNDSIDLSVRQITGPDITDSVPVSVTARNDTLK